VLAFCHMEIDKGSIYNEIGGDKTVQKSLKTLINNEEQPIKLVVFTTIHIL
jgi:hypothetical protein